MTAPIHLLLAALLLAAAPQQQAAVKWGLWRSQGGKIEMIRTYDSKNDCLRQAQIHKDARDGWRYYCRIS